jgi:hypothetical protein
MSLARPRFRYDVFVSYSHRNGDWVRGWLVPQLKSAGLRVCIDHESFAPGAPSLTEMERAVLQSRKTVLVLTPEYLQSEWGEFENILAQTHDPAAHQRRLLPVLLMHCDPPARLGMLTYVDFTQSAWREENTERLIGAIRRRPATSRKSSVAPTLSLPFTVPTGALSLASRLYIERNHDHDIRQQVTQNGNTILIEGARQMGKTSLIVRAIAHARSQECIIVDFNFQTLDEHHLEQLAPLLRYLADALYERLQLVAPPDETWQKPLGSKDKLTSFVRDYVLQGTRMPVVVVIDEVDRVFGRSYQNDFFGLLRSWHDERARDPLWEKLNLVLAYSTDPRQAIRDLNQSPFNVGYKIELRNFAADDVWELNQRYGRPLKRKDQLHALVNVIDGHPYLAQRALYALTARTHTLTKLLNLEEADTGPFADLLHHHRRLLESDLALRQAMLQVLRNGNCPNYEIFARLRSIGLVTGFSHNEVRPRCGLYRVYFQKVLS